jgi:hypothetical protein
LGIGTEDDAMAFWHPLSQLLGIGTEDDAMAFWHPLSQSGIGCSTGLGILIPVAGWFRHQHFFSYR